MFTAGRHRELEVILRGLVALITVPVGLHFAEPCGEVSTSTSAAGLTMEWLCFLVAVSDLVTTIGLTASPRAESNRHDAPEATVPLCIKAEVLGRDLGGLRCARSEISLTTSWPRDACQNGSPRVTSIDPDLENARSVCTVVTHDARYFRAEAGTTSRLSLGEAGIPATDELPGGMAPGSPVRAGLGQLPRPGRSRPKSIPIEVSQPRARPGPPATLVSELTPAACVPERGALRSS